MTILNPGTAPLLVLAGLLGVAVGSFLNVVVHRVPRGESVIRPASSCPSCHHLIRKRHNVPVVSWLILRGQCADCRTAISARYPAVELITAIVFAAVTSRLLQLQYLSAAPAFLAFAALGIALSIIDLETGRLPDALVLPAYPTLGVLLGLAAYLEGDSRAIIRAIVGALASFALFYAIAFARPGGMGFGDVKTAGLIGGMLGFISYSVLLVGLAAGFLLGCVAGLVALAARRANRTTMLPFGPFMVTGALASLFFGGQIAQTYTTLFISR